MAKKKRISQEKVAECFEDSLSELESIVAELEGGGLSLAEALARYEMGVKHLATCQRLLQRAERRIEILSGVDAAGNPITRPYDESAATNLEEKGQQRSKRRTSDEKRMTGKVVAGDEMIDDRPRLF